MCVSKVIHTVPDCKLQELFNLILPKAVIKVSHCSIFTQYTKPFTCFIYSLKAWY